MQLIENELKTERKKLAKFFNVSTQTISNYFKGSPSIEFLVFVEQQLGYTANYKKTKNIKALQEWAGHTSIQTTEIYIQQLGMADFDDFYNDFPSPENWS